MSASSTFHKIKKRKRCLMSSCRKPAPKEVCKACFKINGSCTQYCRDAFIYDPSMSDKEKVDILIERYLIGGKPDGLTFGVKLPENIVILLNERLAEN